jgi:diguanylate cyclase (GGDEF)-like protein
MLDNASLLIGIAFSSAALMIALLIGWLHSRQQIYLVHGAAGIGLVVISLLVMGLRGDRYDLMVQLIPFTILLAGLSLVYSGARLFNRPGAGLRQPLLLGTVAIALTATPLLLGFSGIGTIMLNLGCAFLMFLSGWQYWRGRNDMRLPLLANATLYTLSALSFLACAIVLILERQWILDAPPSNWAENFNSIMSLVGLTGIGAISLTLHHARAARLHRDEANTDSLTGVLNRRALFSRYSETDIVTGLAVVMFDLDHFKLINDRLGHAQGDIVLQSFAQVLRSELRSDDVIARLGGEEFCVILPGLDRDTAHKAAERVRLAFAAMSIAIGDHGEIATVSAGIAAGGIDETFSSTLRRADAALYKAKKSGRNQVHVAALRLVA